MRKYSVAVDQSGKVENLSQPTALAYSTYSTDEEHSFTIRIPSRFKQNIYENNKDEFVSKRRYCLKLFSAGIYILTHENVQQIRELVIDEEYTNNGNIIKGHLSNFYDHFYGLQLDEKPNIKFQQISSLSTEGNPRCHNLALEVFRGVRKPDEIADRNFLTAMMVPTD